MNIIMKIFILILTMSHGYLLNAQDALPYYEIPSAPMQYTATNIASRLIDGLGFRYYWATEGLREEDLGYKPNEQTRSTKETMFHIYSMSVTIHNVVMQTKDTVKPIDDYAELRRETLYNFKNASDQLTKYNNEDLDMLIITTGRGEKSMKYPFWYLINGQIADCLVHTGQIISYRRTSGNPVNNKAAVFTGKVSN